MGPRLPRLASRRRIIDPAAMHLGLPIVFGHYGHVTRQAAMAALLSLLVAVSAGAAETGGPSEPGADDNEDAARYRQCVEKVNRTPEAGFENAIAWQSLGGGDSARHCVALALLALGHNEEAARRLEALARETVADVPVKADILGQAGQAWLLADNPAAAEKLLTAAIHLKPDDAALLTDRSQARAARDDLKGAIADLDRALAINLNYVDALVFRSSAHRLLGDTAQAGRDITVALQLDPGHPEGLLERGMLRRLAGDETGARRDWLAVIEAAPGSAAAAAAQSNIERMDGPARDGPQSIK